MCTRLECNNFTYGLIFFGVRFYLSAPEIGDDRTRRDHGCCAGNAKTSNIRFRGGCRAWTQKSIIVFRRTVRHGLAVFSISIPVSGNRLLPALTVLYRLFDLSGNYLGVGTLVDNRNQVFKVIHDLPRRTVRKTLICYLIRHIVTYAVKKSK